LKNKGLTTVPDQVKIIECPRDAWQGLAGLIPAARKAAYLRSLIDAGFAHIDAASFVSPAAVPQMADSEAVLDLLGPHPGTELIAIVVNERGAERAIKTGAIDTLGFPYSISPSFLKRNQNQTPEQSLEILASIQTAAQQAGKNVVAYISMAFGNPYDDPWSVDAVVNGCAQLIELGIRQISLADTVGLAMSSQVADTVCAALAAYPDAEIGVHLHARRDLAAAKIRAAYEAGCRRFDAALGGLGGCPFAQDDLVGNIPTEVLLAELKDLGAELPTINPIDALLQSSAELASTFAAPSH
jgi:hydroxymethylglutaryl-CoA lyase